GIQPLEVHRRGSNLDRDQGWRLAGYGKGPHQLLDLSPESRRRVCDGRSRLGPWSQGGGRTEARAPAARERPLSHAGRREDLGEDERREYAALLLLAGACKSAQSEPCVLLVDAGARVR